MAALRVVVWDVDDTLYLERSYAQSGFRAAGDFLERRHGVSGFSDVAWDAFERGARGTIFNVALEVLGVPVSADLIQQLVAVYRRHVPAISLLDDAAAAIASCAERGLAMAVITDGPLPSQRAKVLALGLGEFARPIICTSALGAGFSKPNPQAFEMVADRLDARGGELVYVADNPHKDFRAPRALGWRTLRVRREGGLHAAAPSHEDVDLEVSGLTGFMDILAGLK